MLGINATITCDEECDWQTENSPIKLTNLRITHHNRIIQIEALTKIAHRPGPVVHRNTDDLQALVSIFVLKIYEARDLFAARITPGSLEVQENDLAAVG